MESRPDIPVISCHIVVQTGIPAGYLLHKAVPRQYIENRASASHARVLWYMDVEEFLPH